MPKKKKKRRKAQWNEDPALYVRCEGDRPSDHFNPSLDKPDKVPRL